MKLHNISFEGTKDEFQSVKHLFGQVHTNASNSKSDEHDAEASNVQQEAQGEDGGELTADVVQLAFSRRPLPPTQSKLLKVLYDAGGAGIPHSQLLEALGVTWRAFAGIRGALGRRLIHTPGWPEDSDIATWHWDEELEENRWVLLDPVREVIEKGRVELTSG